MGLSSALNSAMSGLTAASRASGVVSDNIANAMTRGYARRSLELASAVDTGPGVRVIGVHRHADPGILSERRNADADFANAQTLSRFQMQVSRLIGSPGDAESIGARIADLETSLISATSLPDSAQRLGEVVNSAGRLTSTINAASDGVAQMRSDADRAIGLEVERLNDALGRVQTLNLRITSAQASGGEIAALMDQRQVIVDEINEIVPVNQADRAHGQIALYTEGGAILLDGRAAVLGFDTSGVITPDMTLAGGALSALEIDGVAVDSHKIGGGSLSAHFEIRDDLAVATQTDLDSFARDLMERFEAPGLDPTTAPGDAGLFTDAGSPFDPVQEVGLAGRIQLNSTVDPATGGDSWRLRAGLAAANPGQPGEARQLSAFAAALTAQRPPASAVFGTGAMTFSGLGSSLMSRVAQQESFVDQRLSFATAGKTEMTRLELAQGVDTDAEMQTLMMVEQAYSANARMIEAIDEMIKTILRL